MKDLLLIFAGGGLGSVARFFTGKVAGTILPSNFPYGTLASNVLSSLVLGLFLGSSLSKIENDSWRFFIAIGFCGGFSTFSSFSNETFELLRNGEMLPAGINIVGNVIICLLMIGAGYWITKSS